MSDDKVESVTILTKESDSPVKNIMDIVHDISLRFWKIHIHKAENVIKEKKHLNVFKSIKSLYLQGKAGYQKWSWNVWFFYLLNNILSILNSSQLMLL